MRKAQSTLIWGVALGALVMVFVPSLYVKVAKMFGKNAADLSGGIS